MSDLEGTSSNAENNLLGDETDEARLLSDSHVEPESETSGPSSDDDDDNDDGENPRDAAKANKR